MLKDINIKEKAEELKKVCSSEDSTIEDILAKSSELDNCIIEKINNKKGANKNMIKEDILVKQEVFDISFGKAILLEGDKNKAIIKVIVPSNEVQPYIIVKDLELNKDKNIFEWSWGRYFKDETDAFKEYNKYSSIN